MPTITTSAAGVDAGENRELDSVVTTTVARRARAVAAAAARTAAHPQRLAPNESWHLCLCSAAQVAFRVHARRLSSTASRRIHFHLWTAVMQCAKPHRITREVPTVTAARHKQSQEVQIQGASFSLTHGPAQRSSRADAKSRGPIVNWGPPRNRERRHAHNLLEPSRAPFIFCPSPSLSVCTEVSLGPCLAFDRTVS